MRLETLKNKLGKFKILAPTTREKARASFFVAISRRAKLPAAPWFRNLSTSISMADVAEVAAAFNAQGFEFGEGDDVAEQCLALCHHFQASPEDLATSWDSYYTVNQAKMKTHTPTAAHMEPFRAHFERHVASAKKSNAVKTPQAYVYGKRSLAESLESGALDVDTAGAAVDASLAAVTPGRKGDTPGAKTARAKKAYTSAHGYGRDGIITGVQLPPRDAASAFAAMNPAPDTSAFAKRPLRGTSKTELNADLPPAVPESGARREKHAPCVTVTLCPPSESAGAPLTRHRRFMRDRIADKVDMLESRLEAFRNRIRLRYPGLKCSGAVYAASQDDVAVIGRIVCDSEGRLNEQSVQLEGSIATSNGARVRVELRDVPNFSLFPGQIVCAQGQNPSGHCLVAKRIIASAAPAMARSPPGASAHGALTCAIASGPFSCVSDLSYEPFHAFLAKVSETEPDALVLLGPFVDSENARIRGDDAGSDPLELSFEEVFAHGVRDALESFLARSDAKGYRPAVILVPSVRDVAAPATFPQPPLADEGAIEAPRGIAVVLASNPGTFTVNGVRFSACTQDILRHLSASEAARDGPSPGDRMARLASHLPGQRSSYPLFPPAKSACLDASLAGHLDMDVTPDVLLLPSDLNPFAKVVPREPEPAEAESAPRLAARDDAAGSADENDAFVAINPGRVAKGNSGGTFALVRIAENDSAACKEKGEHLHRVGARARVDVVRV
jgi:DNA polymerase alpha subunit B